MSKSYVSTFVPTPTIPPSLSSLDGLSPRLWPPDQGPKINCASSTTSATETSHLFSPLQYPHISQHSLFTSSCCSVATVYSLLFSLWPVPLARQKSNQPNHLPIEPDTLSSYLSPSLIFSSNRVTPAHITLRGHSTRTLSLLPFVSRASIQVIYRSHDEGDCKSAQPIPIGASSNTSTSSPNLGTQVHR